MASCCGRFSNQARRLGWHSRAGYRSCERRLQRFNQRQATVIWALADQLGFTARDLKRLAGKYGELDWQNTHPENMQFYPSQKVMVSVIRQLKQERNLREMELKQHGNVIE